MGSLEGMAQAGWGEMPMRLLLPLLALLLAAAAPTLPAQFNDPNTTRDGSGSVHRRAGLPI
jgi:hypothetical protein